MSNLIDRQAAIDAFWKLEAELRPSAIDAVLDMLKNLPSVQPERKRGKWTRHFDGNEWYWYCSLCKEQWYEEDLWMGGNSFPNFCPNCGCRMEEGDSE